MAARTRTLINLRADVRQRADVEGATDRHPDANIDRYINQGAAELRDLLIESRGRTYFRSDTPFSITTLADTTRYALPTGFLRLISIRVDGTNGYTLDPFAPQDEPFLRSASADYPTHYELQPNYIEILPTPTAGLTLIVEYIKAHTDLVADDDPLEGYDGWEEYVVDYAAHCIATKDDERELKKDLEADMARLADRIRRAAANRDAFRAERVNDVRGTRLFPARRLY